MFYNFLMEIKCNKLLRPIFNMVANIGIGLPHAGYETKLMMAGVKPCLITAWPSTADKGEEDYTQLQPLIDSGQIVVAGIKETSFPVHIICHAADVDAAQKQAVITPKMWGNIPLNDNEIQYYNDFLKTYCGMKFKDINQLNAELGERYYDQGESEIDLLLNSNIRATLPLMTGINNSFVKIPKSIADKISSGELCAVHVRTDIQSMAVLAQRDCLDMGKELFAITFKDQDGYKRLHGDNYHKRVGELLGYTKNDTAYFTRDRDSDNKILEWLREKAEPTLLTIRAETMIYDANQPK